MNTPQKILTVLALLAFVASLIWAPWEGKVGEVKIEEFAPIWSTSDVPIVPPILSASDFHILYKDSHLKMQVLAIEWGGLAVIYTGLFFVMCKKTKSNA